MPHDHYHTARFTLLFHSSSTDHEAMLSLFHFFPKSTPQKHFWMLTTAASLFVSGSTAALLFYCRRWIQRSVQRVQQQANELVIMRRRRDICSSKRSQRAPEWDLSTAFVQNLARTNPDLRVMSLGAYLDSLEPGMASELLPPEELEVLITAALLRLAGQRYAGLILPALRWMPFGKLLAPWLHDKDSSASSIRDSVQVEDLSTAHDQKPSSLVQSLAATAPGRAFSSLADLTFASVLGAADFGLQLSRLRHEYSQHQEEQKKEKDEPQSIGDYFSFSSSSLSIEKEEKTKTKTPTPMTSNAALRSVLQHGEVESSADTIKDLPNPFIFSQHWDDTIARYQASARSISDPDAYPVAQPVPVSDALLPDLYLGAGGTKGTHTFRQMWHNRLLSIIMNRLMANHELLPKQSSLFQVQLTSEDKVITDPSSLIQALREYGCATHVESTIRVTTFGYALSVYDNDEHESTPNRSPWIHIPLMIPLRSGLMQEQSKEQPALPIPGFLTHSCIAYRITTSNKTLFGSTITAPIDIEFYLNQDGYTGWNSGHYGCDVPWMYDDIAVRRNLTEYAVEATEISTLLAVCLNSTALAMQLPNGGYGITGVCNDSAAMVEAAVGRLQDGNSTSGCSNTDVYPLVARGGHTAHVLRRLLKMKNRSTVAQALHDAMQTAPNDIHPLPHTLDETARRIVASLPKKKEDRPFVLMNQVLEKIRTKQYC